MKGSLLTLGCLAPIIALAVAGAVVRIASFRQDGSWSDAVLGSIAGVAAVFFSFALISGITDSFRARIVPYFDQRVGLRGSDHFRRGFALARHCKRLDELATEAGIPQLSSFGFKDDLCGEELEWHRSADGVRAVIALRERVTAATVMPGRAEILKDLLAMEAVLVEATKQGRSFCLILRDGADKFISPLEMDRRAGSFW